MVVQTAVSSVPHPEAGTIIFPYSVLSSGMVREFLSSCPALSLGSIQAGITQGLRRQTPREKICPNSQVQSTLLGRNHLSPPQISI